jgi:hypothetical protein
MHIFDVFFFFFCTVKHNHMTRGTVPEHVLSNDVKIDDVIPGAMLWMFAVKAKP